MIADWLRISCTEARRRLRDAGQLIPRTTITGETLPPELPATAQVWRDGLLDPAASEGDPDVRPRPAVGNTAETVEGAERFLAEQATASCDPTSWKRWRIAARC